MVPDNVDIATQDIFQIAEDTDTFRQGTLGVLAKLDLVDHSAERRYYYGLCWPFIRAYANLPR